MGIFCLHPYIALSLEPDGRAKVCCSAIDSIVNTDEITDVRQVFNHPKLQEIRDHLAESKWPQACYPCKNEEIQKLSKRSRFIESWKSNENYSQWKSQAKNREFIELIDLTINLSNICNLDCAMCSSNFSSKWINHEDRFFSDSQLSTQELTFTPMKNIWKISDKLLSSIAQNCQSLKRLRIKGGEPFADKKFLPFLNEISSNIDRDQELWLSVQTNGSFFSEEFLQICDNFNVDLGISIDGIDKIYEWIRGTGFNKIHENLIRYANSDNINEVIIDFATSAFNYKHLPEFLEFILSRRAELTKLVEVNFSNIAMEPWTSARTQPHEDRLSVWHEIQTVLSENKDFFSNIEYLQTILTCPQTDTSHLVDLRVNHMNQIRGFNHPYL